MIDDVMGLGYFYNNFLVFRDIGSLNIKSSSLNLDGYYRGIDFSVGGVK